MQKTKQNIIVMMHSTCPIVHAFIYKIADPFTLTGYKIILNVHVQMRVRVTFPPIISPIAKLID